MCSGIGAPEVAAPWVDWRLASEIENFPRAVLQERHGYKLPDDHNQGDPLLWGDMTEVTPELARARGVPLPDVLVAGTPCQAFSVAGLRKGTDDARGNLTLKFVETCHAIVNDRHDGRLAVLWENVPGVLSDKGNAFGCFLGGLVGADDALRSPDGGSWPSVGMVSGPRARAAWRVLDAQYFGVAQRRRRVFVVVDFGGAVDPAAVLFERQGLRGNTPPSRKAGQIVAALTSSGVGTCGADDSQEQSGHLIPSTGDISHCLNAGGMGRCDYETETMIAHSLRGEGFDASEDGTGRGTPLVPIAYAFGAQNSSSQGDGVSSEICATLDKSKIAGVSYPFNLNQITSTANRSQPAPQVCHTIPTASCAPHLATPWAVRRLTPNECHSLQGFPQDYCAITYRKKPAADGPQYKALGNSMAVPVIAWIMDRIRTSAAQQRTAA
jgi:DNA (cytosine-5)-methyltransferase 1